MSWHLKLAARVIRRGGVVAYPTEGVYGLGCDPLDPAAVFRILELKGRAAEKGLILLAHRFEALAPYVRPLTGADRQKVFATWPGPVTWLLPARPETPWWLTGAHETQAVRVTAHPLAAALCAAVSGALVSTSANPSGRAPARSALQVRRLFGDGVDLILHGPTDARLGPSTIRRLDGSIVRA